MSRLHTLFAGSLGLAILILCLPLSAAADTIRIVTPTATVRLNASETATAMLSLSAGTVIEDAVREGAWFKVTLPPDANGFRRLGYVTAKAVEVVATSAPPAAVRAAPIVAGRNDVVPAGSAPAAAPGPASSRDTVAVMDFEYGTIRRWWSGTWDVGKGIADLVVDELVNGSSMRVIERKRLVELLAEQELSASDRADISASTAAKIGKLLGARYLIFGSITQFSYEEGGIGGAGRLPVVGGLGVKTAKAHVGISARMIDSSTGEIIASANTTKQATRRNVTGAAAVGRYGGGLAITSSQFHDTILGEATKQAIQSTTQTLLTSMSRRGSR